MINKRKKRQVNTWFNYCIENEIDCKKVFGNKKLDSVVKNQHYYNDVKKKIAYQRQLLSEKESNKVLLDKIKKDYKKAKNKQDLEIQKVLVSNIGNDENTLALWDNRKELGLTKGDLLSKNVMDKAKPNIVNKFINEVTNEINYTKKGEDSKIGGFFKYHMNDRNVENALQEIQDLMKTDCQAMHNSNMLVQHLYEKILYQKYYAEGAEYGKIGRHADDKFWKSVSKQLVNEYKKLYNESNEV